MCSEALELWSQAPGLDCFKTEVDSFSVDHRPSNLGDADIDVLIDESLLDALGGRAMDAPGEEQLLMDSPVPGPGVHYLSSREPLRIIILLSFRWNRYSARSPWHTSRCVLFPDGHTARGLQAEGLRAQ